MTKKRKRCLCILLVAVIAAVLSVFYFLEKNRLYAADNSDLFEKNIEYQGKTYHYNDRLLTFLVMGIYSEKEDRGLLEGEADANFLCVFDPGTKQLNIISLNRNSMVDIDLYNKEGIYLVRDKAQLAIQHGFGVDKEQSSLIHMIAVQRMMMGIPIHGHIAVDMSVVEQMNHAVGGVWVTVLEDLSKADPDFVQGKELCLSDEQAFWYVKYRDWQSYASADRRLERDKQFLEGFLNQAKDKIDENFLFPYHLYEECGEHIYTNLSTDRILMLLMLAKDLEVQDVRFYNLPGETKMGEVYEEFYIDEEGLLNLILDLFYEEGK